MVRLVRVGGRSLFRPRGGGRGNPPLPSPPPEYEEMKVPHTHQPHQPLMVATYWRP